MKKILVVINILVSACLILSNLAPYVAPSTFGLLQYFGLFFLYILGVNLLVGIISLIFKSKFYWLSLILIVGSVIHLNQIFAFNFSQNKEQADLKITSYNVRLFDKYNWLNPGNNTKVKIYQYLNLLESDIYCFQEFYSDDDSEDFNTRKEIKTLLKTPYEFSSLSMKKGYKNGLQIFSKYPIVNQGELNFASAKTNKAIWVDLKLKSDTIRVYNFHIGSIHLNESDKNIINDNEIFKDKKVGTRIYRMMNNAYRKRENQIRELREQANKSPHPVFLIGDLNDTPISFAYKYLSKHKKDAFLDAGLGLGSTYTDKLPANRIDYILIPEQFEAINFDIQESNFSDHRAISSTVKIQ